ncbi:MAG: small subunit ribosomal protein S8 [Patescibacteria group bacterium]|jgi:small subunit ribosomal protein S8
MSQDIIADGLNQIMNAKLAGKRSVTLKRYSKVLLSVFTIMKEKGYIDYSVNEKEKTVTVDIVKLNKCQAVKPRYSTPHDEVEKYLRRFLPSRNFGSLLISTNQGIMTHNDAMANKIGGSLIAYFY